MATQYSPQGAALQGVSINNDRRIFGFGDRVSELRPQESPFFTYLSKVAKKPTDDPVFKFLEQRHQWQRRNMKLKGAKTSTAHTSGTPISNYAKFDSDYDVYGKNVDTAVVPSFVLQGQVVAMRDTGGTVRHFRVSATPDYTADTSTAAELDLTPLFTATTAFADNADVEIVGSAFGEATGVVEAWKDEMYNREGYCQIFKTAIPLFSGTALATRYRGRPNEWMRVWKEKLMEHKVDIEKAMLFGVGTADEAGSPPVRRSWGILPYAENYGKTYTDLTYGGSNWDKFLDIAEDFFAPELGNSDNKLVLCSRKIATWLNKMGQAGYVDNTVGSSSYRLNVDQFTGQFSHKILRVETLYGNFNFVIDPFLRGPYEDYAVAVDLANVAYRPLSANGVSRDTFIKTNVQDNDVDGRQDLVTTEAGLEISLPETHAIMKWS